MSHKTGSSLLVMALLAFFVLMFPGVAHAQSTSPPDCSQTGDFYSNYTQDLGNNVHTKVNAIHNFYTNVPMLDLKLNYCINKIEALFNVAVGMGDPTHILGAIAEQMLLNIANQVCTAALQTITQIEQFALSQFNRLCIPLPKLNLNLGNLNLKAPVCNGINPLGIKTTVGGQALPPGLWQIWGSSPGNPGSSGQ